MILVGFFEVKHAAQRLLDSEGSECRFSILTR